MTSTTTTSESSVIEKLKQEREICTLYIDSAKSYIQLSTGALLLSLAFSSEFIGASKSSLLRNWPFVITWFSWLVAILTGVTYQYCAIKYLETIANDARLLLHERTWPVFIPRVLRENPFFLYGVMMLFFYLGIIIFSGIAIYNVVSRS